MAPPLWQKVKKLKSLLMKVKVQSEKVGLKLSIQKMKIMASGPIISWEIDGETVETVSDFIFLGSKITADGNCSHEIKRRLFLGRKVIPISCIGGRIPNQWTIREVQSTDLELESNFSSSGSQLRHSCPQGTLGNVCRHC